MPENNHIELSVISPVYRAEEMLDELASRVAVVMEQANISHELILVDDGSPDQSWQKMCSLSKSDQRIKSVKLSRNFGQHYAVTAGLELASGRYLAIIDCDLQDRPDHLLKLLDKAKSGYDIVFTRRIGRKHGFLKSLSAAGYNALFRLFSNMEFNVNAGSMVLFTSSVKAQFLKINDYERLYIQLLRWLGFQSTVVEVTHDERFSGRSTYSFWKLVNVAIQGWTFHSDRLLRVSVYSGFLLSFFSLFAGALIVLLYFFQGFRPGWPSLFLAILFSTGLILTSIGVTGIYIGKIFKQVKNRPLYIIQEKINLD